MTKTMLKQEGFGEVAIGIFEDAITFACKPVRLDAIYDIKTGKITGMGSRACEGYILQEVEKILNK